MKAAKAAEPGQVQSLTRALGLLDVLAGADQGLSLSEVAAASGLALSTVHRLLTTLQLAGYVRFAKERGLWQIGVQAFIVGSSFKRAREITAIARPVLRRLVEDSGETANLAIPEGEAMIYLAQEESPEMMRAMARIGARVGLYCSALGKAVMAYLPERQVRKLIDWRGLPQLTPNTITAPSRLFAELETVRRLGYAVDDEEHSIGMRCAAAAIFDDTGLPVGAVSLSGPMARVDNHRIATLGELVRQGALDITAAFGGRPPDQPADQPPPMAL